MKYPYVVAYEKYMGAKSYYIQNQVAKATEDKAPEDAYRYDDRIKRWLTVSLDMPEGTMKIILTNYVLNMKAPATS